jgi:hypothetical protein
MIKRLDHMPDGTLGFRIHDELEREDSTEVLIPALRAVVDSGGRLRTVFFIDDLDEMEPGAVWEDAKTGFNLGLRKHEAWERTAIVTDQEWLARAARLFAWMAPGELKVYPAAELEQAKRWVSGAAGPPT